MTARTINIVSTKHLFQMTLVSFFSEIQTSCVNREAPKPQIIKNQATKSEKWNNSILSLNDIPDKDCLSGLSKAFSLTFL